VPRNEQFGWVLFSLSGVIFLVIGFRTGDILTIIASILWLAGCALFLQSR